MKPQSSSPANSPAFARRPGAWIAGAAVSAIATAVLIAFGLQTEVQADTPPAAPPATPVSVATVSQSTVSTWDEFSGRLEAVERVDIRSRVAGAVQSVHFREGALVKQGDLLLTIDPAPYEAEVARAEAQVAAAQARQAYTQSDLARAQRLWDEHAISQRDFDERANAQREADANLRAAQAALQSAKLNLGYTQVRAPVAGRVGRLKITAGNLVSAGPGAPVLTTLVSVSPIYASFDADEQVVSRALRGLSSGGGSARASIEKIPVRMGTADMADTPIEGHLQLVDNQVDARSGTVRVRAVFDNPGGQLIPGQFARLRLGQAQAQEAVLVNERAVGTDQNKKFVMVVDKDSKAAYREVVLGAQVDGLRIVTRGLQPGERIVVNGLQRVRPGSLLAPQPVAMDAKPEVAAAQNAGKQS